MPQSCAVTALTLRKMAVEQENLHPMGCFALQPFTASHLPIIIHDRDEQTDLIHVLRGNVKDYCFIVSGIKCIFLYGGFLLFQSSPITEQRHFDIRICRGRDRKRLSAYGGFFCYHHHIETTLSKGDCKPP